MMQMDGFDQTVNVKVIMATNRADTLDPALLRPGRLDRKIEFPLPDRRQKRLVFQVSFDTRLTRRGSIFLCITASYNVLQQVCTAKMNLSDEVDLEDYVSRPDKISAAEVCTFEEVKLCVHMFVFVFCHGLVVVRDSVFINWADFFLRYFDF